MITTSYSKDERYIGLYHLFAFLIIIVSPAIMTAQPQEVTWKGIGAPYLGSVRGIVAHQQYGIFVGTTEGVFRLASESQSWMSTDLMIPTHTLAVNANGVLYFSSNTSLYRSTNGGQKWIPLQLHPMLSITVACYCFGRGGTIYVGTLGHGVFRSTDDGAHWSQMNFGLFNPYVYSLAIDLDGMIYAGTDGGVYRTSETGGIWSISYTGLFNGHIMSLCVSKDGYIFASTADGVYRSKDDGVTWLSVSSGWSERYTYSILCASRHSKELLIAGASNGAIYQSNDGGENWKRCSVGNAETHSVAIDSSGCFWAGGDGGLYRSSDEGGSWAMRTNGLGQTAVNRIAVTPAGSIIVVPGNNYVFPFRTDDNGFLWKRLGKGLPSNTNYTRIVVSHASPTFGSVYLASEGAGVFVSTDDGDSWKTGGAGLRCYRVYDMAINSRGYLFATTDSGIFRLAAGEWTRMTNGMPITESQYICINEKDELFAGTSRIYKSTNNGESWSLANPNYISSFQSLTVSRTGNSRGFLFASSYGSILRSSNGGATWMWMPKAPSTTISSIIVNRYGALVAQSNVAVYMSVDTGNTWKQLASGMPSWPDVRCLTVDTLSNLYVGTSQLGVYKSTPLKSLGLLQVETVPSRWNLSQNFPNPFTDQTTIRWNERSDVEGYRNLSLKIYDLLGKEVLDLTTRARAVGEVTIHRSQLPKAGAYLYRMSDGRTQQSRIMHLIQ